MLRWARRRARSTSLGRRAAARSLRVWCSARSATPRRLPAPTTGCTARWCARGGGRCRQSLRCREGTLRRHQSSLSRSSRRARAPASPLPASRWVPTRRRCLPPRPRARRARRRTTHCAQWRRRSTSLPRMMPRRLAALLPSSWCTSCGCCCTARRSTWTWRGARQSRRAPTAAATAASPSSTLPTPTPTPSAPDPRPSII
mmetsp:Transcript_51036/g.120883  ORF Transcript_51036/g.120883 Transcript_51036/m.120883 type:complete len:201 (-) Transcript_51036:223-825(-)